MKNKWTVDQIKDRRTSAGLTDAFLRLLPALLSVLLLFSLTAPSVMAKEPGAALSRLTQAKADPLREVSSVMAKEAGGGHGDGGGALWNTEYYRAVDALGRLSPAEEKSLDAECLEFMESWHVDLALAAVTSDRYEGGTLSSCARAYYEECGFGYGPDGDGFMVVWDTETDEAVIEAFGAAKGMITEDYLRFVCENMTQFREKYGIYGPLYASTRYLNNHLEKEKERGGAKKRGTVRSGADDPAGAGAEDPASDRDADPDQNTDPGLDTDTDRNTDAGADTNSDEDTGLAADSGLDAETDLTMDSYRGADSDDPAASHETLPAGEKPDESLRVGGDAGSVGKPDWYPKDTSSFPYYHDDDAPRVVDRADIFTDDEEAQMEARLAQLRPLLQKDLVVFTEMSAYGLSHEAFADDFFDYNGYGWGEDFEGACLMVCMDPADRGWWCSCSGPVTMGLYTEAAANRIDDLLYEYMRDGDYGEGVLDWIENFRRLYQTGSPYNEEWALLTKDGFSRFHDPDAPRIVDDAKLLDSGEIEELRKKAGSLSEKYGLDVVVHTAYGEGILSREEYGDHFFYFNGYGFGDGYDGIELTIFKRPGYLGSVQISASGKGLEKLTEVNESRLTSRCSEPVESRHYYAAIDEWLELSDHMLRTGRVPRTASSWGFTTVLELLAGLIFGLASLSGAKKRMATPKLQERADSYIVKNSVRIRNIADTFLYNTVSRIYSPRKTQDSSSTRSSSGRSRSSYSRPHRSSSGRSHSGSGRRF